MEKETTKKDISSLSKVYYIGEESPIYLSLKSLSLKSKKFILYKKTLNNSLPLKKALVLLDDSSDKIKQEINFLKKKSFLDFFVLLDKTNITMIEEKSSNFFLKPLRIFDLHEELYQRIKRICAMSDKWRLDRANLHFCGNNNQSIQLTEKEYNFLYCLLNSEGNLLDKEHLLKKVWRISLENKTQIRETRVVETLVSRIRKKLSKYSNAPKLLKIKEGYKVLV